MTKGQKGSDGLVVPQGRRKAIATASQKRGGKRATASETVGQIELFRGTADSPKGGARASGAGQPAPRSRALPKPRTTKNLFPPAMTMEEIAEENTLREAFARVASNRGAPGPDGQSIDEVRAHLEEVLAILSSALLEGRYRPGRIRRVWIPKPGSSEPRGLGVPNVIDRIVGQAVHQVLSPHFEGRFHASSHGFRPGRSCHTAIAEAKTHLEAGHEWVVDLDLSRFFDRVHHERLLARLEQFGVEDRRVLKLVRRMLKADVVLPDGVVVSTPEGTPQGGPLSPLLSNVVLDELDQEFTRRGYRFVRYADDTNVYVRSERAGQRVMASVIRFIEGRLRLKVNREKSAVARPSTRHFVGFRLTRNREDGAVRVYLSERSRRRINRKVIELTRRNWGGSLGHCIERINRYLEGWIGFFRVCSRAESRGAMHVIDAHIRRRLRAIALRQKKRRRFIFRFFLSRGVKRKDAVRAVWAERRSLWALSHTVAADKAMSRYYFRRLGLLSLQTRWGQLQPPPPVVVPVQLTLQLG
jgi:RNA-directed DNA polymerase